MYLYLYIYIYIYICMYIPWGKPAMMWETHGFRGKMVCWSRICGVSTSTDPSQSEPSLVTGHIPISGEKRRVSIIGYIAGYITSFVW